MSLQQNEFIRLWACGERDHLQPGGCWSANHMTLHDVKNDTVMHAATCKCWRHRIIAFMEPEL